MTATKRLLLTLLCCCCWWWSPSQGSRGDQSPVYHDCWTSCEQTNCSTASSREAWQAGQQPAERWLGWTCSDNCGYECMWYTVDVFTSHGMKVPQFHGKWPFLRVLGVQEPASVLFSLMNLLSNAYMLRWLLRQVPRTAPMYKVWVLYSLTCIHAWFWSTVFHTRDTPLTEMMDYFSAFSMVLYSLVACLLRLSSPLHTGVRRHVVPRLIVATCLSFFLHHVYSMAFVKFDYGHNMRVNIAVAAANSLAWLYHVATNWGHVALEGGGGGHVSRDCLLSVLAFTLSSLLEVLDFPPWLWLLDSHSLWHLATVPIPLLWYRFIAGDCLNLMKEYELRTRKMV